MGKIRSRTISLALLAASSAHAFQQGAQLRSAASRNQQLYAVTDPITLLGEDYVAQLEAAVSTGNHNYRTTNTQQHANFLSERDTYLQEQQHQQQSTARVRFHGITTTTKTKRKPTIAVTTTTSRSSTMPGYSSQTKNQQSTDRQVKRVEDATGRDFSTHRTKKAVSKRKAKNGEAMYQKSASVPDSLVQFARELHREERITPTEELELGRRTQEAIRLQSLYDNLETSLEREPTDTEWCAAAGKINMEAIRQAIEDGMEAKNKLVTSNLRMVQGVVNVYIRNGLGGQYNAGDMMQEGIMALIRAAEKFEPQRGFRFSTYAMYWIRSAVKRSQTYQSRVITVPQRLHANHKKVKLSQRQLQQALGRPPTQKELADASGMSVLQLERCVKAMEQRCYSLDQQLTNRNRPGIDTSSQNSLHDIVESKTDDGDVTTVSRVLLREDLIDSLYRSLDRESAHIIMLRYGLVEAHVLPRGYGGALTIAQVSQLVSMKPDKVRRRIIKSLKELKFSIGNEWKDFE